MINPYLKSLPHKANYTKNWLLIINNPSGLFKLDWHSQATGLELRKIYLKALDCRINQRAGLAKNNEPMPDGLIRDKRRLEEIKNRVRHYQFESKVVKKRFGHLLSTCSDF